ncbi:MAG: hypothetical protein A3H23_08185 [Planctomycetes bacterium RIFCSPLOWO2_12_FULL_40_19]|nr:MAG: hypothetical protein A3H23_08185 [Planctomycetes bacterium RIFCSPLOWO2_12_FULL_40_19]
MTALTRSMHSITNNIGQASCLTACSTEAGCLVYFNRQLKSKKKVVGFLPFKTQPNLMYRNFKDDTNNVGAYCNTPLRIVKKSPKA